MKISARGVIGGDLMMYDSMRGFILYSLAANCKLALFIVSFNLMQEMIIKGSSEEGSSGCRVSYRVGPLVQQS